MNTRKHPFSSLLFVVTIIALLAFPISAGATHSWGGYHWARTSNPFTIKLGDNVSSGWDSYLTTASTDWSASSVLNTTVVAGGTSPKACRPTAGRVEVCTANYRNTGWLGIASIWITGGEHITQGTVKNNDYYFNQSQYNTPAWHRLVMCQEIGHTFGLDHQDENFDNTNLGTCMDYTSNPEGPPSNEHPNQHDYDQLVTIYTHLDSTTTIGAAPAGFANADMHAQDSWGKVVRTSADGKASLYVRDFGNGYKIFTFVIWAQE